MDLENTSILKKMLKMKTNPDNYLTKLKNLQPATCNP